MNPIGLVTGKLWLYVGGAVIAMLAAGLVAQTLRLAASEVRVANLNTAAAESGRLAARASLAESEKNRREEQRRITAQKESDARAQSQLAAARADAADVADALRRLRNRVAADAARRAAAGHPQAVASSPAASPATNLPADVLGGLGEAAGQLAAHADAARIAGLACQRSYESLTEAAE